MSTQLHTKHFLQIVSAICVCAGLFSPSLAQAQNATPPPPTPEQRREMVMSGANHLPSDSGPTLQPNAAAAVTIPWSKLAFQSYRDGNWEIYAGNDDGSNLARLTNNSADDMMPRMNRGATRIAFASKRDGDYEIFTMNMDGSGLAQLTNNTKDDVYPAWSPDGTKIAFQSYRDGNPEIYVMNADGSHQTRLTNSSDAYDTQPTWSPDGSKIAFISGPVYDNRLYVMNADGSNMVDYGSGTTDADPVWSPDGQNIAFDGDYNRDGWQELFITQNNYVWKGLIQAPPSCDAWAGSWSPDSRYVAYTTICYVYYQNAWYWTTASMAAVDKETGTTIPLAPGNTEWNPDWQTTDITVPVTSFTPLPPFSPSKINLEWGVTNQIASGVKDYIVQAKDGADGEWQTMYFIGAGFNTYQYTGTHGHTYYFRVRTLSNAYNTEPWPADYDVMTTVESLPPDTYIRPLPPFIKNGQELNWGGVDPGGSGISSYDVQERQGLNGAWTDLVSNANWNIATIYGISGLTYYFRVRGVDSAGNVEDWPAGDGNSHTTFYNGQISGVVHDNAGAPVVGATINMAPAAILPPVSGLDGSYNAYFTDSSPLFTANWSKTGYGSPPQTTLSADSDTRLDITLPPTDDVVRDGGFESGSLAPADWQVSGSLPAATIGSRYHTGQYAAQLGDYRLDIWNAPEKVSDLQKNVFSLSSAPPRLVIDSQGTAHAIWADGAWASTSMVYYASKPYGGDWSTPAALSESGVTGPADIAIDGADTLYVAWSGASAVTYRSKPLGGEWTAPATAMPVTLTNMEMKSDTAGNLHILGQNSTGVIYSGFSGGQWSAPTVIDPQGYNPHLAVDSQGGAHAVWIEGSLIKTFLYASHPENGAWSPASQVSSSPSINVPNLWVDEAGNVYLVWAGDGAINLSIKPAGSDWGDPEIVAIASTWANHPVVRVYQGRISVSYEDRPGTLPFVALYYTERASRSGWTQPVQMTSGNDTGAGTDVETGPDRRVSLIWLEYAATGASQIIFRQQFGTPLSGDTVLAQTLTIPGTLSSPTLAFHYMLQVGSVGEGAGLNVSVQTSGGEVSLAALQSTTPGWAFQTFDLSQWSGQEVTLVFRLHKAPWGLPTWALIDDVSLGSSYADVWVTSSSPSGHAGDQVTFAIACGNQGGAPATNAHLSVTLPAGLTFVSAEPMPTSQGATLTSDLGDLEPKTGACSIQLTAAIDPTVSIPQTLTADVEITSDSTELETENNVAHPAADVPYYKNYVPAAKK